MLINRNKKNQHGKNVFDQTLFSIFSKRKLYYHEYPNVHYFPNLLRSPETGLLQRLKNDPLSELQPKIFPFLAASARVTLNLR